MSGCNCKDNIKRRALRLVNGKKWEQLDIIETGQLAGLYQEQFKSFPTDEEIKNWLGI